VNLLGFELVFDIIYMNIHSGGNHAQAHRRRYCLFQCALIGVQLLCRFAGKVIELCSQVPYVHFERIYFDRLCSDLGLLFRNDGFY
jgi:hypothetical protein